jgi:predicted secreted protein
MLRSRNLMLSLMLAGAAFAAHAQSGVSATGAQIVVPATGELTLPNDQVRATLMIEEQGKDKALAASRVNQKMQQGIEIVKRQDPQAQLKTHGYFTYAVYADTPPNSRQTPAIVGWRVGQYLQVTSTSLTTLPKTIAAAQAVLTLNGLEFGLAPATSRKLDDALIAATYQNLNQRIASIARAMGRSPTDAVIETIDFEGSGNYANPEAAVRPMMMRAAATVQDAVAEPSFEPGESTVSMRLVGKLRFR